VGVEIDMLDAMLTLGHWLLFSRRLQAG